MKRIALLALLLLGLSFSPAAAAQIPTGFTVLASGVSALTFNDATCSDQTTCYYVVLAADAQGHLSSPAPCSTTVLCFGGNQAVAVMPSSGTHTVVLTWVASATAGVTYTVARAVGPLAPASTSLTVN